MHHLAVGAHAHSEFGRADAFDMPFEDDDLAESFRLAAVRHRLLFLDGEAHDLVEVVGDEGQAVGVLAAPVCRLADGTAFDGDVAAKAVVVGFRLGAALTPLAHGLPNGVPSLGTL